MAMLEHATMEAGGNGPLPISNLKFRTMAEFVDYHDRYRKEFAAIWHWQAHLGDRAEPFTLGGYCDVCGSATTFSVNPRKSTNEQFDNMVRWSGIKCKCGLSATERRVLSFIDRSTDAPIYHVGYFSELSKYLLEKFPNVERSQFKEGYASGFIDEDGIRYEDLTGLSFSDGAFNILVCTEILEHIPDYLAALKEMRRCLDDDGIAILTFPWLGGSSYEHRERARLREDGTIEHLMTPSYHGDPASTDGVLCFNDFGWKILDEIRQAGFSDAYAQFIYSPVRGYMTVGEPVIIAKK